MALTELINRLMQRSRIEAIPPQFRAKRPEDQVASVF